MPKLLIGLLVVIVVMVAVNAVLVQKPALAVIQGGLNSSVHPVGDARGVPGALAH